MRSSQGRSAKPLEGGGLDGATLTCRHCEGELHEVYFGDNKPRWRCMKCDIIYELWEYRIWGRGEDDMCKVLAGDGKGQVEGEKS
jgi:hypothetical protein